MGKQKGSAVVFYTDGWLRPAPFSKAGNFGAVCKRIEEAGIYLISCPGAHPEDCFAPGDSCNGLTVFEKIL